MTSSRVLSSSSAVAILPTESFWLMGMLTATAKSAIRVSTKRMPYTPVYRSHTGEVRVAATTRPSPRSAHSNPAGKLAIGPGGSPSPPRLRWWLMPGPFRRDLVGGGVVVVSGRSHRGVR